MKKTVEFYCKCKDCDGTGIYKGMGEGKNYGVVCFECNGTGRAYFKFEYEEFKGKEMRNDIKTVLQVNPGICLGENYDFGGMSYKDWFNGKPFPQKSEMRKFTCPAWWYQSADYEKKPNWKECHSANQFNQCFMFKCKEKCWERFDKEQEVQNV